MFSSALPIPGRLERVSIFGRTPVARFTASGLRSNTGKITVQFDRYIELDTEGNELFSTDTSHWPETYGAPAVVVFRSELTRMLSDAVGLEKFRFDHDVVSVENAGDMAICHFGNGESYQDDVLIVADGINSQVHE